MLWSDFITDALQEIGVYAPGDTIEAPVIDICVRRLNYLIDEWAALQRYAYNVNFNLYTLPTNQSPITIGPGSSVVATFLLSNVATYAAQNNFQPGDLVSVKGCTNGGNVFNVTGASIIDAAPGSFTVAITHADVAALADNGRCTNAPANSPVQTPVVPDWLTANSATRPTRIEGCNLVLNSSKPSTDLIVNVRDDAWWLGQQVKSITSTIPTDLYYSPDFQNGSLYFWPIPTVAYQVRLEVWNVVNQINPNTISNTQAVIPQAYSQAMMLTLAERICRPLSRAIPAGLAEDAMRARAALQSNNISSPRIASADYGTGLGRHRAGFNWQSGGPA